MVIDEQCHKVLLGLLIHHEEDQSVRMSCLEVNVESGLVHHHVWQVLLDLLQEAALLGTEPESVLL